jgi:hypothetical protein
VTVSAIELFRQYTSKAGDVNRQFALAGIALIWLLNGQAIATPLKGNLNVAFWCITLSLTLDLLQYLIGAAMWGYNHEVKDASTCRKTINVSVFLIFAKLIVLIIGYFNILYFLKNIGFLV